MIKYIGAASLITVGILIGNSIYSIYQDRLGVLKRFYEFILFCENEIIFYKKEMNAIIEQFREKNDRFDKIIFNCGNTFLLKGENQLFIKNFFNQVTELDSETQKYFFSDIKNKTRIIMNDAEKEINLNGKMFRRLTPIIAIGIMLLLIF